MKIKEGTLDEKRRKYAVCGWKNCQIIMANQKSEGSVSIFYPSNKMHVKI